MDPIPNPRKKYYPLNIMNITKQSQVNMINDNKQNS